MIAVRELPPSEQPQCRARAYGFGALSNTELLQIVCHLEHLETGTRIIQAAGGLDGLAQISIEELTRIPNVGPSTAIALKAALELGDRAALERSYRHQIRSPQDAYNAVAHIRDEEQEHFAVVLLDTKNRVIETYTLYIGNVNTSVIRVAEVFKQAIRRNAVNIVIAHNHPSGDPNPSPEDVRVTERIVEAGRMMDIEVLDHIVVGKGGMYVSLKERGLGFK